MMSENLEMNEEQQTEQIETQNEVQVESPKKDSVNPNWEEAREVLRLQKQRIEDLESRLASQNKPMQVQEEEDELEKLDPEDYVTVGKARELATKLATKQASQTAKQVVQEYIQQQQIVQDEQRMRSKFEDYDYVIDNFALPMIKNDPALAYKIQMSKNPAETAYKLAKISDEYEGNMTKQQTNPKAEKILKNSSRPVSSNAVSPSLKSQADDFSKMNPSQVWEMSQKYARGA